MFDDGGGKKGVDNVGQEPCSPVVVVGKGIGHGMSMGAIADWA